MANAGGAGKLGGGGEDGGQAVRITRTGIALVHEGEVVLPAAGSEAAAERVIRDETAVINYYFPVEIEVRGAAEPLDPRKAIEQMLSGLKMGVDSLR